jgi:hypothetical protein
MQSSSASVPSYNVVDVHYNKRRDLQSRADNMARRHASPIYCLRYTLSCSERSSSQLFNLLFFLCTDNSTTG